MARKAIEEIGFDKDCANPWEIDATLPTIKVGTILKNEFNTFELLKEIPGGYVIQANIGGKLERINYQYDQLGHNIKIHGWKVLSY